MNNIDEDQTTSKSRMAIINLKILGELKNGVKLNTHEKYFTLDDTHWYQPLRRLYRGDNRNLAYEKISELVSNIQELFDQPNTLDMTQDEFKIFIIPILEQAKKGLLSLKDTYHDDKTFTAQIDVEISTLGRMIYKNRTSINETQYIIPTTSTAYQQYQQPYDEFSEKQY